MFELQLPEDKKLQAIMKGWLILGVVALAIAGVYAILLVSARSPYVQEILPFKNAFHTALIIHVNLSVLFWLLCMSSLLWTSLYKKASVFSYGPLVLAVLSTLLVSLSPFVGESMPLINNYVPILENTLFYWGLGLLGVSVLSNILLSFSCHGLKMAKTPSGFAIATISVITLLAFLCLALAYQALSTPGTYEALGDEMFFELLFWGGGHLLQFSYTNLMLIAWLVLAGSMGLVLPAKPGALMLLFGLSVLFTLPSPVIYALYDITSFEHINFFTQQMRGGGGVAAIIVALLIFIALFKGTRDKGRVVERNVLFVSMLLFLSGGVLGFLITSNNVVVPAHYHGSIIGITLALMGLSYHLLPRLGYGEVRGKLAAMQPILYGGGQLLHITGLAWSGGYGALRKTPAVMESFAGKASMGLMGLGGLLSIIGGLLFVIVVYKAITRPAGIIR